MPHIWKRHPYLTTQPALPDALKREDRNAKMDKVHKAFIPDPFLLGTLTEKGAFSPLDHKAQHTFKFQASQCRHPRSLSSRYVDVKKSF